jgi:hypothetical protein
MRSDIQEKYRREYKSVRKAERCLLGDSLTPGWCTSLDLADAKGNNEISDDGVFGLTRTM